MWCSNSCWKPVHTFINLRSSRTCHILNSKWSSNVMSEAWVCCGRDTSVLSAMYRTERKFLCEGRGANMYPAGKNLPILLCTVKQMKQACKQRSGLWPPLRFARWPEPQRRSKSRACLCPTKLHTSSDVHRWRWSAHAKVKGQAPATAKALAHLYQNWSTMDFLINSMTPHFMETADRESLVLSRPNARVYE